MSNDVENVRSLLAPYGVSINAGQFQKIRRYVDLLTLWNKKVSLTTIRKPEELIRFHFGESLFALQFCDFKTSRLADVGSGAGFPALALKILRLDLQVTLIEPNLKKSAFLAEVVRSLDLPSVETISRPFSQSGIVPSSLDFVTSRAVSQTPELLAWSFDSLMAGGSIVLWSSDESANQIRQDNRFQWGQPQIIPATKHRAILIGQKAKQV